MKVTAKGSQMATKCANLTEHTWDLGEECLTAGGCVSSMEWDPLGGRLAVIFQGNSCVSHSPPPLPSPSPPPHPDLLSQEASTESGIL